MFRTLLLIFLGVALGRPAGASPYFDFSGKATECYRLATSLRLKEAQGALNDLRKSEPDNYLGYYLENCIDVIAILSTDNREEYVKFQKKMLPRIDKVSRGDRGSPYYLFCQAEMHLHGALLQGRFGNYLSGMSDVKQAYALLEENERRYPDFQPNQKSLGLLHAMVGSIPEEYRWTIKAIAGMKGDVQLGKTELEGVVDYARAHPDFVYGDEALATYAFLLLYADNQKEQAWKTIRSGALDHHKNPLAAYVLAIVANRTGHNDEAIRYLEECPGGGVFAPFPFRYFMLGVFKLCRLDPDARQPLEQFLAQFKGELSVSEALQKLAWQQLLEGNEQGYKGYMEKIKALGSSRSDPDKVALREAESGEEPDLLLLKARLLFDGGYFQRAYDMLKDVAGRYASDRKLQLEYNYRMGRIAHALDKFQEAVRLYNLAIDKGAGEPWYFACNAALQLGMLYEDHHDPVNARAAYSRCLAINPEEYAESLHARAKAGLNRLR